MCFILSNYEIKQANEDIVCYKILKHCGDKIISFYYDFEYEPGKVYSSEVGMYNVEHFIRYDSFTSKCVINGGVFHSYITKPEDLLGRCTTLIYYPEGMVFKCTIPKGAHYMENKHEYVSDKIRIDNEL